MVVLTISVHVVNGEGDDCHLMIVPVCPLSVNVPLVEPLHIVVPPLTLPPTEVGVTVSVAEFEYATGQVPF